MKSLSILGFIFTFLSNQVLHTNVRVIYVCSATLVAFRDLVEVIFYDVGRVLVENEGTIYFPNCGFIHVLLDVRSQLRLEAKYNFFRTCSSSTTMVKKI